MSRIKTCVSLYSLQCEFMAGTMKLEDVFRYMKELEVEGIELLPDQMLHGTPEPSEETYAEWDRLVEKYGLDLACDDIFLNTNLYKNRELTKRECVDLIKKEIVMAHRLGFKVIRLVSMVPAWVLEPVLPTAEKYGISLCIEIHGGLGFDVPKTEEFLQEMLRLNSPYIGIVPDASLFCKRVPRVITEYYQQVFGTSDEIVRFVDEIFARGSDLFSEGKGIDIYHVPGLSEHIVNKEADEAYAGNVFGFENRDLSCMDPYVKNIQHFHFKLYEMTDEGEEYSIDYREILEYLYKHGYDGYVSTEYEGNRWVLPGCEIPEKEQIAKHQKMLKKLLKEIQG